MASLNDNARTSAADVKEIFETDISDDAIRTHINAAAAVVDEVEAADPSVSDSRLSLIERYVAAHFASSQDPRTKAEEVGSTSKEYRGPDEKTQYWQTATSLDPTGALSGDTKQIGIEVLDSR